MSRTRIVKGNITKITGGNYKIYSKDTIENIGLKVIQVGKEGGVSYGEPEKLILKEGSYEVFFTPSNILPSNNVISCIEIISGKDFIDNDIIMINNEKINYWLSSHRKIYFIPKDNLSTINLKKESIEYNLLNKPKVVFKINEVINALDKQLALLHKASEERYEFKDKSNKFRKDQILVEGYYRFQKALEFIENTYKSEKDLEVYFNWLNKNSSK